MSSLREVKDRIASVRSTLKITSAMKLVASSKLLRAQRTIEALRPYSEALGKILSQVQGGSDALSFRPERSGVEESPGPGPAPHILLAFAGNASMCGAFNANAIKAALQAARACPGPVEAWAFGRKMAQALSRAGVPVVRDFSPLIGKPDFDAVAAISAELRALYQDGRISGATLVYNHFVSAGRQQVVTERYLEQRQTQQADNQGFEVNACGEKAAGTAGKSLTVSNLALTPDYIFEPSRGELLASLLPQVLDLRLYAALLDSVAAEHAARMIAMQTATDNAENLLAELTLEYNKGRQQKITSEILDLVAGEVRA
ncbi:MAG: ATP synthase F1 subunit gamma [Bacteroidales bacterium]|nr:ATP synthase F1 subunit gamma [Bacteroidales bacterium]